VFANPPEARPGDSARPRAAGIGDGLRRLRDGGSGSASGSATPNAAASSTAGASSAAPTGLHTSTYKVTGNERVKVVTNRGTFTISLYPKDAPNTVATFLELVSSKFYDGIKFHRVEPGFVVQAGDPQTKNPKVDPALYGTGGPGFKIKAEINSKRHLTGTVAMARGQEMDSAGSQFLHNARAAAVARRPVHRVRAGSLGDGRGQDDPVGDTIKSMTIVPAQ